MRRFGATLLATLALLGSSTVIVVACACAPRVATMGHCCCARRARASDSPVVRRGPCCAAEIAARDTDDVTFDDFAPRVAPAPILASYDDASPAVVSSALATIALAPARSPPIITGPPLYLRLSSIRC